MSNFSLKLWFIGTYTGMALITGSMLTYTFADNHRVAYNTFMAGIGLLAMTSVVTITSDVISLSDE